MIMMLDAAVMALCLAFRHFVAESSDILNASMKISCLIFFSKAAIGHQDLQGFLNLAKQDGTVIGS